VIPLKIISIYLLADFGNDLMVSTMTKQQRIILPGGGAYHAVSRVVDRNFVFGPIEKEVFRSMIRRLESFLEVRVLTYCLMSNHFHLLLEVPDPESIAPLSADSLRKKLAQLYQGEALAQAIDELDRAVADAECSTGSDTWLLEILERYQARMGDLSVFCKELKARFTLWYNARNSRSGTLWEGRFKSVVVEGDEHALMTMAAYIELNPVRAGIVDDPKDYRWCGYAEAVAGGKLARRNLSRMHARTRAWDGRTANWREVGPAYRLHLFGHGVRREGDPRIGNSDARQGIDEQRVEQVIADEKGRLPVHVLMRCRVRYFCDGTVFGRAKFVDAVFKQFRERFSDRRQSGARAMRGADWGGLTTARNLRKDVIGHHRT